MAHKYLNAIYHDIFNEQFNYNNSIDRLNMQNIIYLSLELGIPIGDYGFRWFKRGLYSQSLDDDMKISDNREVNFSKETKEKIQILKNMVQAHDKDIDITSWVIYLASLLYCRKYVLSTSFDKRTFLKKLRILHDDIFINDSLNERVYDLITSYYFCQ